MTEKHSRRKLAKRFASASLALLAIPLGVAAYDALQVSNPPMPAVGETAVGACDGDGVSTTYTYGSTSNNGVKVVGVTVSDIAAECANGTVGFMTGTTEVAAYTGNVASGLLTLATNVWTNDFTSVRVALYP
ncbi:MAG: hypothetical protein RLY50_143 [Actinomycetota bacterium]